MPGGGAPPGPRRLGLTFLAVLAVLVCAAAAWWQWDRANRSEADAVPETPAVALADLDPATAFSGMQVRLRGEFDVQHEVLVDPRPRDGRDGSWVLTPLLPTVGADGDGPASVDGAALAVVRGWIPRGERPAPPPPGVIELVGVLVADSRRPDVAVVAGDPPTVSIVDTGALSAHAGYPVRSGWYALRSLRPTGVDQPLPLQVTELPGADVGLNWRNAAYAIQWVVFAVFVVVFWNRFRREPVDRPIEQERMR